MTGQSKVALFHAHEALHLMEGVADELARLAASLSAIRLDSWEGNAGRGARGRMAELHAQLSSVEEAARRASAALSAQLQALESMEARAVWCAAMTPFDPPLGAWGARSSGGTLGVRCGSGW